MKTLTRKNVEVLQLWSEGMDTKEIAKHLGSNIRTIGSRIDRARRILGATHTGHAVALAMASGLIAGPPPVACVAVPDRYTRSLADFAEDYTILRGRGLTRPQIATEMGVKHKTVGRLVTRARKAGLLPPWRGASSC